MSLHELETRIGTALSLAQLTGTPHPTVDERYLLQRILGRGASGLVVEAFDDRLHRSVALKLYAQLSERVLREGRALAKLDHPNVLRVFDVGEGTLVVDGRPTSSRFLMAASIVVQVMLKGQSTEGRGAVATSYAPPHKDPRRGTNVGIQKTLRLQIWISVVLGFSPVGR